MYDTQFLLSKIKQALEDIDFNKSPVELYQPLAYSLSMGGKRIRPLLALLSCDMFGGNIEDALYPAVGLELFHNFTLIHDDIMDKAMLRRGKATVYRKWNSDIAILSGDTMFAIAYQQLIKTKAEHIAPILEAFNTTAIEVCEGQQHDMNFEREAEVSISQYMEMIRLKTASLISASFRIGAITGNADNNDADRLHSFGENIGIAFQIMDDYLDVYGDSDKFGKSSGGDIRTNKKTYLYLKACELADDSTHNKLKYYYSEKYNDSEQKVILVKEIYDRLDINGFTIKEIDRFYNKAYSHFNLIAVEADRKEELRRFTDRMMRRES